MPTMILKKGSTGMYKGERVKILEVIGNTAYIFIPSRQDEVAVDINKLKNIRPKPRIIK